MAGNNQKWLEIATKKRTLIAGYGWKWLEMAGKGLKWNGLITVFWIQGVWDVKNEGFWIEGFPIGSSKTRFPGIVQTDPVKPGMFCKYFCH